MGKLIAIDNGHGINTPGKRTPHFTDGTKSPLTGKNFMHEWEFNYATANYLDEELKRCGFRTLMTSDTKEDTDLMKRCDVANRAKADLFISIHANAFKGHWGNWGGIETLTWGSGDSLRAGKLAQDELVKATGLSNRGMKDGSWLAVIKYTKMPSFLVECGFMDNLHEAKLLLSEDYRRKCAVALAKAICRLYGVDYVEPKKPEPEEDGELYYRVVTGSFKDRENAEARIKYLKEKAGVDSFLLPYRK